MEGCMNRLKAVVSDQSDFAIFAELTSGREYSMAPIKTFLSDLKKAGKEAIPDGFNLAAIALPQNPGGVANLDPMDVMAQLGADELPEGIDLLPHLSCKDHNRAALNSILIGYRQRGIKNVLALTGDKPVAAKGVFDVESVGLLQMISSLNRTDLLKASSGQWDGLNQLNAGAAVSPFKYTEASQMQQYYKMEKKAKTGARFFITQVGWDWRKSAELVQYCEETRINQPIIGNVYLLSTTNAAPRLMRAGKLPGCYVSDALFEKLKSETFDEHLDRAAQQVAMYKALGVAGVDIGGVHDFGTFRTILEKAAAIGSDWEPFKENLCYPPEEAFYLYTEEGQRQTMETEKKSFHQRRFNLMHRTVLDPDHKGFHALKKTMQLVGAEKKPEGVPAKSFMTLERIAKNALFDCEECGDCYLAENFGYCTMGGCAKGLANAPCGDGKVDGTCGNEEGMACRGEQIYLAAKATRGIDRLRTTINNPRKPELEHSSSILNYLFGKDHTMPNAIITIGEAIHASIPKTGAVMRELQELGAGAYKNESHPLEYMRALVESQAADGADYIAINVDAFGESDPQLAVDVMCDYVRLVRHYGNGVPACIDSSDDNVLKAGLAEWYKTDLPVKPPLVNSIKVYTADEMMALKKEYDFSFIGLLMSESMPKGEGGSHSVEELVELAKEIFDKAVNTYGFKADDIFFDSTVFPLAIDMPMQPDVPGYTYRAFETIRAIKSDPVMKGVHFSFGVSNSCRDLPGRKIGICRAYVEKAMEYGLDAGIVNSAHHYGQKPADPSLVKLVTAYAEMDGGMEKTNTAIEQMGEFCNSCRK